MGIPLALESKTVLTTTSSKSRRISAFVGSSKIHLDRCDRIVAEGDSGNDVAFAKSRETLEGDRWKLGAG